MLVLLVDPDGVALREGAAARILTREANAISFGEQRAEGQILLDGEDILTSKEDVSLIRAKVGMVFQKPTPFPM